MTTTGVDIPKYMIIPTPLSTGTSVVVILALFLLYMVFIGYIASYNLKFYPNFYMFWNFITSGNNKQYQADFESYVVSVMKDAKLHHIIVSPTNQPVNSMEDIAESFANPGSSVVETSWSTGIQDKANSWYIQLQMMWNQLLLKSFVQGKTIRVTRL